MSWWSLLEIKHVAFRYSKYCHSGTRDLSQNVLYCYSGIQSIECTLSLCCSLASELLKLLAQQERLLVRDRWTRPFSISRNPQFFCSGNYKGNINILILILFRILTSSCLRECTLWVMSWPWQISCYTMLCTLLCWNWLCMGKNNS